MSFFGLIFLAFFIWLISKLIKGYMLINNFKKQSRQMYEQRYGASSGNQPGERKRKPGWSTPSPHRKKIDPNVGEYVSFQEISVTESSQTTTDTSGSSSKNNYTTEQQVTDAEWVDIP